MKKKEYPLISVIISAYNHEKYIKETIDSIINQTYPNLELIVIDDGSTDQTYNNLLNLKKTCDKRFLRTVFKTQENKGVAYNSKQLISMANGEYVYMIGSDDVAKPHAISFLYEFLSKNKDYGLASGDNELIDSNSNKIYWDYNRNIIYDKEQAIYSTLQTFWVDEIYRVWPHLIGKMPPELESSGDVSYEWFWYNNVVANGYLVRKSVLNLIKPHTVNVPIEDIFLHFQITKYSKEKVFPDILASYRWHQKNTVGSIKHDIGCIATRMYELYLIEEYYPEINNKYNLTQSPMYCYWLERWNIVKKSKLWDEKYYCKKYPEIIEEGWIPLVHYVSFGSHENYYPSAFFEKFPNFLNFELTHFNLSKGRRFKLKIYYSLWKFLDVRYSNIESKQKSSYLELWANKVYKIVSYKLRKSHTPIPKSKSLFGIKERMKNIFYCIMIIIGQLPFFDMVINKNRKNKYISKVYKNNNL